MKRGNDGEKIMMPMFPRLHVNDTEKGGPRAPPRNKMALYEQLSIPSQRFNHAVLPHNLNNSTATSVPQSSLAGGNSRGMFTAHPSQKQYSQYSELSTSQVEQSKNMDEDDYAVPIFIQPIHAEFDKYNKGFSPEKLSPSATTYSHPSLKYPKANKNNMLDISIGQEGGSDKGENSSESAAEQTVSSISHELGDTLAGSVDRLTTDGSEMPEEALPSGDENIINDLSDDTGSDEDGSCRPRNLERGDSVSETSILDTEAALDITPDDVVGVLGQTQFWKARKAIMNQQRIFAVQVFELHRLIKVQKLIAASPHLLLQESTYSEKSTKPSSQGKKRPLDYAISNAKGELSNPSHKKECSAENTLETAPFSSPQNIVPPSRCRQSANSTPPPSDGNENTRRVDHPQLQGQQWLIPMMSPSEGLIYKPCPPPAYAAQGSNLVMADYLPPLYGAPSPSPQYPFPPFPPYGPHGYFPHPHYTMPVMSSAAFTGPSVDQTRDNVVVSDGPNIEVIEVQGSSASFPSERRPGSRPCRPTNASKSSPRVSLPERATRVIKVVPRNGLSASESAARIFRSIQEERQQNDSV